MNIQSHEICRGCWVFGLAFFIVRMHLTFKCHNQDCHHDRDTRSLRIVICQNFHNHSSLVFAGYRKRIKFRG